MKTLSKVEVEEVSGGAPIETAIGYAGGVVGVAVGYTKTPAILGAILGFGIGYGLASVAQRAYLWTIQR